MTRRTPPTHAGRIDAAARTMRIDWVTSEVVSELADAGIEAIVMKGAVFRALLYDGKVRDYIDSDLLLSEESLPRAREVLRQAGLSLQASPPLARRHEERWQREPDGVRVELHWTIWGAEAPPAEVFAALRAASCPLEVAGRTVQALGPGASALVAATHAAQHGLHARATLEELELALSRLELERWREASAIAHKIGATAAFTGGLGMTPAGERLANELNLSEGTSRQALLAIRGANLPARYLEDLSSLRGARARIRYLGQVLFPPPAVVTRHRPAERGRIGLMAAYARRLVRGVGRLAPALVALARASRDSRRHRRRAGQG